MTASIARAVVLVLCGLPFAAPVAAPEIEIIRDAWGVPHVYASSLADASFGLAYAQAQDGLEQILRQVVAARAQAAAQFGRQHLEEDYRLRLFRIPEISTALYDAMSADARASLDGYAAGINRYLEDNPTERPPWFDRMTGRDGMAMAKRYELLQHAAVLRQELVAVTGKPVRPGEEEGSNSWAVAPTRTTDGSVMLLADPHMPWAGPTRYYEFQLVAGGRWAYGAGYFGSATVAVGLNPDVAWASTNNGADTVDVYREQLEKDNPDRYRYDGEWRPVTTETIEVEVQGEGTVRRTARRTHHGPIVLEDPVRGVAYSARVAGLETTNLAELGPRYFAATSVRDMHSSNRSGDHCKWNRITVDRQGHIGFFYFAATHRRDDALDWGAPVDGTTKATEWGPRIRWDELPAAYDPPSGFLLNCNNSPYTVTSDCPIRPQDFPRHLAGTGTTLSPLTRAHRATELITALPKLSFADLKRISMDVKAVAAAPVIGEIVAAYRRAGGSSDRELARAVELLTSWDGEATADNLALPILASYLEVAGRSRQRNLAAGEVVAALDRALDLMTSRWGSIEVPWGRVHVHRRGAQEWPLEGAGNESSAIPFVTLYQTGARGLDGGRWIADQGSSWMMLVRYLGDRVDVETLLPWGNSDRPGSPHFADQAPLFAKREYKRALLTRDEVEAAATSRLALNRD